jgi:uncharacterized protein (DUF2147 family)
MRAALILSLAIYLSCSTLLSPEAATAATLSFSSPVGKWKTVDDRTGKARSVVEIYEEGGKLAGKIDKLIDPELKKISDPKCVSCTGDLKDKPIVGLRILWDLKQDGNEWTGGKVLDPESGKSYRCLVAVEDGGKKLKVRGFIGFSLIGRTQYWQRDQ